MGTCHSSFLEVSQLQLRTPTKVSEPVKRRDERTPAATRRVFDFVTERAHIDRSSALRFLWKKLAPRSNADREHLSAARIIPKRGKSEEKEEENGLNFVLCNHKA